MARRVVDFKIPDAPATNRDHGKLFRLTEMSPFAAEKWAAKALLALMKSGVNIPEDYKAMGLAALAGMTMKAFGCIEPGVLLPLMDEMLSCVQCIPDPRHPDASTRALVEEDIEEVTTLLKLREKLLDLHLGFSLAAKLSTFSASAAAMIGSQTTSTSLPSSE
jgi:hypothetical protein